jgi:hypothetical protein
MAINPLLGARVTPETKRRVRIAAERQLIKTSVWLRRVIAAALGQESVAAETPPIDRSAEFYRRRLTIRIRPADLLLLKSQAFARGMKVSTYGSVLIRSHLRNLSPLPKAELLTLRQAVSELGAIARSLSCTASKTALGQSELRTTHCACEALRRDIKALIAANAASWGQGHASIRDGTIQGEKITTSIRSRRQYPNSEPNIRNSEH